MTGMIMMTGMINNLSMLYEDKRSSNACYADNDSARKAAAMARSAAEASYPFSINPNATTDKISAKNEVAFSGQEDLAGDPSDIRGQGYRLSVSSSPIQAPNNHATSSSQQKACCSHGSMANMQPALWGVGILSWDSYSHVGPSPNTGNTGLSTQNIGLESALGSSFKAIREDAPVSPVDFFMDYVADQPARTGLPALTRITFMINPYNRSMSCCHDSKWGTGLSGGQTNPGEFELIALREFNLIANSSDSYTPKGGYFTLNPDKQPIDFHYYNPQNGLKCKTSVSEPSDNQSVLSNAEITQLMAIPSIPGMTCQDVKDRLDQGGEIFPDELSEKAGQVESSVSPIAPSNHETIEKIGQATTFFNDKVTASSYSSSSLLADITSMIRQVAFSVRLRVKLAG